MYLVNKAMPIFVNLNKPRYTTLYIVCHLIGSLWAIVKVITITKWFNYSTFLVYGWGIMGQAILITKKWLILLSMIQLSVWGANSLGHSRMTQSRNRSQTESTFLRKKNSFVYFLSHDPEWKTTPVAFASFHLLLS